MTVGGATEARVCSDLRPPSFSGRDDQGVRRRTRKSSCKNYRRREFREGWSCKKCETLQRSAGGCVSAPGLLGQRPHTGRLGTADVYSLGAMGSRSPKPRCQQGHAPPKAPGKTASWPLPACGGGRQSLAFPAGGHIGHMALVSASVAHDILPTCLCLFSRRHLSCGLGPTLVTSP